jgi:hypothetical protein
LELKPPPGKAPSSSGAYLRIPASRAQNVVVRKEFIMGVFLYFAKLLELSDPPDDSLLREKWGETLPPFALHEFIAREAVLNALSHSHYQLPGSVFGKRYLERP